MIFILHRTPMSTDRSNIKPQSSEPPARERFGGTTCSESSLRGWTILILAAGCLVIAFISIMHTLQISSLRATISAIQRDLQSSQELLPKTPNVRSSVGSASLDRGVSCPLSPQERQPSLSDAQGSDVDSASSLLSVLQKDSATETHTLRSLAIEQN